MHHHFKDALFGRSHARGMRHGQREDRQEAMRRGGGRIGRFLAHGDLRFLLLKLISEKPSHGYELIKEIEDRVAGAYTPSPGVIYPTLTLLEELGWARVARSEGTKKLFEVTADGLLAIEANKATVDDIFARMDRAHAEREAQPAEAEGDVAAFWKHRHRHREMRNALHELRDALRHRAFERALDESQVDSIVDIIRTATKQIRGA
ncbi:PadR family transcriptional regulator [Emcibacter sp. SYSU 3D8]|uniref:PadR family transcriptional regulator n=1 Tax=Emcibacter sp. SYSU 3D8 TaxID=3133969 RepID=UPI0031FE5F8E